MTQQEESQAPEALEALEALDADVQAPAPEATHETIDPFLNDFAPAAEASGAETSAVEAADAADALASDAPDAVSTSSADAPEAPARKPGPPNVDALPSAADAIAALESSETPAPRNEPLPEVGDVLGTTAPTTGPTVGAGSEEDALAADPLDALGIQQLEEAVIEAMRTVYDPEIPVNIYELGLIYELDIDPQGRAVVEMTLTSPACPVAGILPGEVEQKVLSVDGVNVAKVELVWEPPWSPDMMSEAAQLQLGFF